MSHVPLPFRVAMGLVVTALEQARKLPEQLTDLPVTAASRAVQAGMRVQQRVTELAIKGDQVFSLLQPVEETAPWATFDEDNEPPRSDVQATAGAFRDTDSGGPAVPGAGADIGEADEADVARALTPQHSTANGVRPGDHGAGRSVLAEYEEMSLAQLRGRLRGFSLTQLEELLEYEHSHQNRPAFITLLSNRISTVRSQ